jgi:hypothetical protein
MKLALRLLVTASLSVMLTGAASALPVSFRLLDVTTVGAAFPSTQTYVPGFPIVGSGDIDFGAGTGTLTLPDYSVVIDLDLSGAGDDFRLDISGWSQTITSIFSGNVTSVGGGTTTCVVLGGIGGSVCPTIPTTVAGWPPADGTLASSAILDEVAQTITIIDNSNANAGTVTSVYGYNAVPEPSTALLLLGGLGVMARRRA